nr:hypothetical protein Iba_chr12bCG26530 [Ipomoea batatas]GMD67324.1 hypothetical protein Iba_chr12cCG23500 [Ipomoea batatas]GMD71354.1 hypothetical protein Iba_chr12eCG15150 [Ipomoea batatas]GMD73831.1 hypothetical protein Iba_chr12fCG22230 [Ipomoea batatas]
MLLVSLQQPQQADSSLLFLLENQRKLHLPPFQIFRDGYRA